MASREVWTPELREEGVAIYMECYRLEREIDMPHLSEEEREDLAYKLRTSQARRASYLERVQPTMMEYLPLITQAINRYTHARETVNQVEEI